MVKFTEKVLPENNRTYQSNLSIVNSFSKTKHPILLYYPILLKNYKQELDELTEFTDKQLTENRQNTRFY